MAKGTLKVQAFVGDSYTPIDNAKVTIIQSSDTGRASTQNIATNSSGLTDDVEIDAPSIDNSMKPSDKLPYSLCDVKVEADGFRPITINGCQIYPERGALQQCRLKKLTGRETNANRQEEIIIIGANTLVGKYPPKIPENPNKPDPTKGGFVVLDQVVVPQYIIVHTGAPDDPSAANYTVGFTDYIKNVASCEIFSTWPEQTIRANLYCIISFTLNRIYTEWYTGKGKKFNITNSTAYDHAFTYGRNIYTNISSIVDGMFTSYVKRPGRKQPLLTQYCDGKNVQCPGWLTQWGSKYLGDQGQSPYEILTHFYGSDLNIETATKVKGIPKSYPGYELKKGSTGDPVKTIQTYLNRISKDYPIITKVAEDGAFGAGTEKAVKEFQGVFSLPKTGVVDYATWYKISDVYVAVTKIGELNKNLRAQALEDLRYGRFIPPTFMTQPYEMVPTILYPDDL